MKFLHSRKLNGVFAVVGILGSLYSLYHFGFWKEWTMPPFKLFIFILFLILAEMVVRAERLCRAVKIVGKVHKRISFRDAFFINASGDVFGAITPASIGGEVARLAGLVKSGLSATEGVKTLAVERLSLLLSLFWCVMIICVTSGRGGQNLIIYGGLAAVLFVLLIVLIHYAKGWVIHPSFRPYLWKWDLFCLSLFHHAVRLGLLPLIVFYYQREAPTPLGPAPLIYFWSLILGYGFSFVPIPSGGGTIEAAFMTALTPLLGLGVAAESLLIWRFLGHYFYVLSGALVTLWGSPLWGSKRFFNFSQPLIKNGESIDEK